MSCNHTSHEQELATIEGACPLCLLGSAETFIRRIQVLHDEVGHWKQRCSALAELVGRRNQDIARLEGRLVVEEKPETKLDIEPHKHDCCHFCPP